MAVRFPEVKVRLTGRDGNVFVLMGAVLRALKAAKVPESVRIEFSNEVMMAGSYDEALAVMMRWVRVS